MHRTEGLQVPSCSTKSVCVYNIVIFNCYIVSFQEMKYNEIVPSNKIINSLQKTIVDPPKVCDVILIMFYN